jgi:hypothetical protein
MKSINVLLYGNHPEGMELQVNALTHFLRDPFEVWILNDAREYPHESNGFDDGLWRAIESETVRLQDQRASPPLRHVRVP